MVKYVLEALKSFPPHPWRYSKVIWTWSWATCCRWPCMGRAEGQD